MFDTETHSVYTINFFEGSYCYTSQYFVAKDLKELTEAIQNKMLEQLIYRPTKETLWAEVVNNQGCKFTQKYKISWLQNESAAELPADWDAHWGILKTNYFNR